MLDAIEAAVFPIAEAYGAKTISTKGWFTGTGKEGAPAGNGNQDVFIAADNTHLLPLGHKFFAHKIYENL